MDKNEVINKARNYLKIIEPLISLKKAYLFGSYQQGTANDDSDIDIALFVDRLEEDYLAVLKTLYSARREVDIRIEPHLFLPDEPSSGFDRIIEKEGLLL